MPRDLNDDLFWDRNGFLMALCQAFAEVEVAANSLGWKLNYLADDMEEMPWQWLP